jgi:thiamine-monophosphate kinase
MSDAIRPSSVDLGPGGEFDLIRRFLARGVGEPTGVRVGPGDDAAVLDGGLVVSTDLSVEDVHFRRRWISDEEIGFRAAAAALSDLAAMAAEPLGVLISMAAPRGGAVDLEAVQRGAVDAAVAAGTAVLGGDLSRSPGPLIVDVTVLGCTEWPLLRVGAQPGDEVWVTGTLGAAAAAVRAWEAGETPGPALRCAFARPTPRLREARCLAEEEIAHALIDLSDGLAGDAGHLAAASGVRIVLEPEAIPVAGEADPTREGGLTLALHGGEDYELCFTASPDRVDAVRFLRQFGVGVTRVGRVEEGSGLWVETDGGPERLDRGGYDHLEATS